MCGGVVSSGRVYGNIWSGTLPCTDVFGQAHHDLIQSRHNLPMYDSSDSPSKYNPSPHQSMDVDSDSDGNPTNMARRPTGQ